MASGDLFELAQDLARLLDSPVTIEDRDTVVIAYAGEHQDVDDARVETILNRQVPARFRAAIAAAGVFDRLRSTDEVIVVDLPAVSMTTRSVVALRDGDELLGSVWAALGAPPTEEQAAALRAAAPVIAREVARARRAADRQARERDELLAGLLAGGEPAVTTAGRLDLTEHLVVAALAGVGGGSATDLAGALALHLSAVAPRSACGPQDETLYAVLDAAAARRIVADFLARVGAAHPVVAGLGEPVPAADLPSSRVVADDVAAALVRRGRPGRLAGLAEVFPDLLVDRLRGFLTAHRDASPLAALERHDAEHDTGLVDAVSAYLDAAGDVAVAAAALHVHPNTIRNRIRRAGQACGVDLADAGTRLALLAHLAARRTG